MTIEQIFYRPYAELVDRLIALKYGATEEYDGEREDISHELIYRDYCEYEPDPEDDDAY